MASQAPSDSRNARDRGVSALTRGSKLTTSRSRGNAAGVSACASTTAIDKPRPDSPSASAEPAIPAPMITTSQDLESAMSLLSQRGNAGGMAHELALQRRQYVQPGEGDVAAHPQQRIIVHEQRGYVVAEADSARLVGPLTPLVANQRAQIAQRSPLFNSRREHSCQFGNVTQRKIVTLARHRVQRVRRIAHDYNALAHLLARKRQRQRITLARAHPL